MGKGLSRPLGYFEGGGGGGGIGRDGDNDGRGREHIRDVLGESGAT